jgi:hypothetical protein
MTTTLIPQNEQALREELDYRESDGVEVSLLWSRADGSLAVAVLDARTAERFELPVEPEQARDAFQHPFADAAFRGLLPEGPTSDQAVEQAVAELERETLSSL